MDIHGTPSHRQPLPMSCLSYMSTETPMDIHGTPSHRQPLPMSWLSCTSTGNPTDTPIGFPPTEKSQSYNPKDILKTILLHFDVTTAGSINKSLDTVTINNISLSASYIGSIVTVELMSFAYKLEVKQSHGNDKRCPWMDIIL